MSSKVYFSESFKIQVVREIETGRSSVNELSRRYGIKGHSTIQRWVEKFGTTGISNQSKESRSTMNLKEHENIKLENEIRELKKELEQSRLRNVVLETFIDICDRDMGTDLRKKYGAKHAWK